MASVQKEVSEIKRILLKAYPPEHFSAKEVIVAFLGSLILGLTFIFKGLLFEVSLSLQAVHLFAIILATIVILTLQIYFIGYARVENKAERPFGQFWAKRFFTFYGISLLVSFLLVYLYGLDILVGSFLSALKVVVAVSFPCAVGTAISDLVK